MQPFLTFLLDCSHVTIGARPFVEVGLNGFIQGALMELEVSIDKAGGKLERGELPIIAVDSIQMYQLFQELIGNGLKFHEM